MTKEQKLTELYDRLTDEIFKVLLTELSDNRASWVMNDINHLIYSHFNSDLEKVLDND